MRKGARIDLGIRTMVDKGCRSLQVCGALDVLRNKEIATVFKRRFGDAKA
ncbi:MAG: hypothetical protein ABFE16_03800 [Armatimonadia bacterium]